MNEFWVEVWVLKESLTLRVALADLLAGVVELPLEVLESGERLRQVQVDGAQVAELRAAKEALAEQVRGEHEVGRASAVHLRRAHFAQGLVHLQARVEHLQVQFWTGLLLSRQICP